MGHIVDFAINGYVAYDVARRFKPDYIICDLGLPGMTGYEVCTQIRKDPEFQAVRMIALTAYDDAGYKERAKQVGFDEFHVKPMDPQILYKMFGDTKDANVR